MSAMGSVDILIKNGLIFTMDAEQRVIRGGDLAIKGEEIVAIGDDLSHKARTVIDARYRAVLPGLVNAHTHETLTRGIAEDLPLDRWLAEICFPLDSAYTGNVMRGSASMNQMEMIRGGTTTFLDIYRFPGVCAEVAEQSGLRAIFAPQVIVEPQGPGESVKSAEEFVSAWLNRNPRITPAFGPHAPYSCPPDAFMELAALAEEYDVPLHTHLSETQWEVETIKERYAAETPAEHLKQIGVLSPRLSVAHGVYLTPSDIELLHEHDVAVVYNPSSNMKMASGVAPIPELMKADVRVGLGTDSNLSNNNLDLFEEMRLGAILQKLDKSDAATLPCYEMLKMATIDGARALGMDDIIGSLEVGKQADVILVDLNQAHMWPLLDGKYENTVEQLVYSASAADVTHTIVAGKMLMSDHELRTFDQEEVRMEVIEAANELLSLAGMKDSYPATYWR